MKPFLVKYSNFLILRHHYHGHPYSSPSNLPLLNLFSVMDDMQTEVTCFTHTLKQTNVCFSCPDNWRFEKKINL